MIKRLRIKFVLVCMLLVTVVLGIVFTSMYTSAQRNIQRTTHLLLERLIDEGSSPSFKGPSLNLNDGDGKVQLPYFTLQLWGGDTVYITGGSYDDLNNSAVLDDIVSKCQAQTADEGSVPGYSLRYLRQDNGFFVRMAFVDISMERSTLQDLLAAYLQIGMAALLLLLGVSVLLSWWVTRPVERAWQQQRQFLSDASHELKTPLTVILSNAELLESAPLPEKPARWSDNIHSEAQRMKTLVEEMLTLARADNMVRTSVYTEVNFSDVATDCALLFEPVAFEAGKTLSYELADQVLVTGDQDKLKQVISVLLDNAIKYGKSGCAIHMTLQKTEKHALLQVSNDNQGTPIPPEQLSHLFERFYRADASRGEQSGFGLGLPIAATIAEEHKGTLKVESDDASTRFLFTLPLRR